jgi:hypothetical protein
MGDDDSSARAWSELVRIERVPRDLQIPTLVYLIKKLERSQAVSSSRLRPLHSALDRPAPRKRKPK